MSETMKEKTRRLERVVKGKNAGKTDTFVFSEVRKMLELAIAEEREAVAEMLEADNVFRSMLKTQSGIHDILTVVVARIRSIRYTTKDDEVSRERAVAKLNHVNGGRMPNRTLWIGTIRERKKAVYLLLKLRSLKDRVKYFDT